MIRDRRLATGSILVFLLLAWFSWTAAAAVPRSPSAAEDDARRILDETGAIPLPDLQSVCGMPFAAFPNLRAYQRHVLMVDEDRFDPYAWIDET